MNRLTQKDFLDRSISRYGDYYDYSKSVYNGQYNKVTIICPVHGEFEQTAKNHMNGFGCNKCGEKRASEKQMLSLEEYLLKAKNVHGETYTYANSTYNGTSDFITITCRVHGDFSQLAGAHLAGHGCRKCANDETKKRQTKTQDEFLDQARLVHGFRYVYDDVIYTSGRDKIKIKCIKHGFFHQIASNHLNGDGCPLCANELISSYRKRTINDFLLKANNKHNNRYDYSLVKEVSSRDVIDIICPIHGVFKQIVMDHLSGCGCQKCAVEYNNYHKDSWIKRSKNRIGTFYIIRCFNETESFYKFGITFNGVNGRYERPKKMPYSYEIVRLVMSTDKGYIWDLEKRFMRFKLNKKYSPLIKFAGSKNECFI